MSSVWKKYEGYFERKCIIDGIVKQNPIYKQSKLKRQEVFMI